MSCECVCEYSSFIWQVLAGQSVQDVLRLTADKDCMQKKRKREEKMVKEASKNNESKANKERQPKTNNPFAFRACLCSRAALMFVFVPVFVFVLVFVFFFHAHTQRAQHVARSSLIWSQCAAFAFCLFAWLLPSQPQHVELESNML